MHADCVSINEAEGAMRRMQGSENEKDKAGENHRGMTEENEEETSSREQEDSYLRKTLKLKHSVWTLSMTLYRQHSPA